MVTSGGGELSVEDLVSSEGCWSEDPLSSLSTSACWGGGGGGGGGVNFLVLQGGGQRKHKSTYPLILQVMVCTMDCIGP